MFRHHIVTLLCLLPVVIGCRESRTDDRPRTGNLMSIEATNLTACQHCRIRDALAHFSSAGELKTTTFISKPISLCEECAKKYLRSAPEQENILVSAQWRADEEHKSVTRQYQIIEDLGNNRIRVKLFKGAGDSISESELIIRKDLVPPNARLIGATFKLIGTPLEIDLIECSAN